MKSLERQLRRSPSRAAEAVQVEFDRTVDGTSLACRRGCAHCCHEYVPVSAGEAFRLADAVRRRPEDERAALLRRLIATDARTRGRDGETRRRMRLPCPL